MPKVKTIYAYKVQSIVEEFPDEFKEILVTVQFHAINAFLLIVFFFFVSVYCPDLWDNVRH